MEKDRYMHEKFGITQERAKSIAQELITAYNNDDFNLLSDKAMTYEGSERDYAMYLLGIFYGASNTGRAIIIEK
jgi:hypothetical protein